MPDKTYRVHMWLTYDPQDSAGKTAFNLRFAEVLRHKWWSFTVKASSTGDFANQLNAKILKACQTWIDQDTGLSVTEIKAFGDTLWSPGGGGQHEMSPTAIQIISLSSAWWTFDSEPYQMQVGCRFIEE